MWGGGRMEFVWEGGGVNNSQEQTHVGLLVSKMYAQALIKIGKFLLCDDV